MARGLARLEAVSWLTPQKRATLKIVAAIFGAAALVLIGLVVWMALTRVNREAYNVPVRSTESPMAN